MAGIEKVCEFSGEYPGSEMYKYKKDLIQVMPKYRKEFYGQESVTLVVFQPKTMHGIIDTWRIRTPWSSHFVRKFWLPRTWSKFRRCYTRNSLSWDYCLIVPSVQGNVQGLYFNYTSNPIRMFRKISKMVGNLSVKEVFQMHCTLDDWFKDRQEPWDAYEGLIEHIFYEEAAEHIIEKMRTKKSKELLPN